MRIRQRLPGGGMAVALSLPGFWFCGLRHVQYLLTCLPASGWQVTKNRIIASHLH
jgi:hypothetical protein